jgi:hypothetical protein
MAQWIVRATPVGYEEFHVLLEWNLFNPAPVEHIDLPIGHDGISVELTDRGICSPASLR